MVSFILVSHAPHLLFYSTAFSYVPVSIASKKIEICYSAPICGGDLTNGFFQGWVVIRDRAPLIESARALATLLKWDARVIEMESSSDERLLICQKPFFKRQAN